MKKLTLDVTGMKCEGCANAVRAALKRVEGVKRAEVSLERGRAELVVDAAAAREVVTAVEEAGYGASVAGE